MNKLFLYTEEEIKVKYDLRNVYFWKQISNYILIVQQNTLFIYDSPQLKNIVAQVNSIPTNIKDIVYDSSNNIVAILTNKFINVYKQGGFLQQQQFKETQNIKLSYQIDKIHLIYLKSSQPALLYRQNNSVYCYKLINENNFKFAQFDQLKSLQTFQFQKQFTDTNTSYFIVVLTQSQLIIQNIGYNEIRDTVESKIIYRNTVDQFTKLNISLYNGQIYILLSNQQKIEIYKIFTNQQNQYTLNKLEIQKIKELQIKDFNSVRDYFICEQIFLQISNDQIRILNLQGEEIQTFSIQEQNVQMSARSALIKQDNQFLKIKFNSLENRLSLCQTDFLLQLDLIVQIIIDSTQIRYINLLLCDKEEQNEFMKQNKNFDWNQKQIKQAVQITEQFSKKFNMDQVQLYHFMINCIILNNFEHFYIQFGDKENVNENINYLMNNNVYIPMNLNIIKELLKQQKIKINFDYCLQDIKQSIILVQNMINQEINNLDDKQMKQLINLMFYNKDFQKELNIDNLNNENIINDIVELCNIILNREQIEFNQQFQDKFQKRIICGTIISVDENILQQNTINLINNILNNQNVLKIIIQNEKQQNVFLNMIQKLTNDKQLNSQQLQILLSVIQESKIYYDKEQLLNIFVQAQCNNNQEYKYNQTHLQQIFGQNNKQLIGIQSYIFEYVIKQKELSLDDQKFLFIYNYQLNYEINKTQIEEIYQQIKNNNIKFILEQIQDQQRFIDNIIQYLQNNKDQQQIQQFLDNFILIQQVQDELINNDFKLFEQLKQKEYQQQIQTLMLQNIQIFDYIIEQIEQNMDLVKNVISNSELSEQFYQQLIQLSIQKQIYFLRNISDNDKFNDFVNMIQQKTEFDAQILQSLILYINNDQQNAIKQIIQLIQQSENQKQINKITEFLKETQLSINKKEEQVDYVWQACIIISKQDIQQDLQDQKIKLLTNFTNINQIIQQLYTYIKNNQEEYSQLRSILLKFIKYQQINANIQLESSVVYSNMINKMAYKEIEDNMTPIVGSSICCVCGKSIFTENDEKTYINQQLKDGTIIQIETKEKYSDPIVFDCHHSVHYYCLPLTQNSQHQVLKLVEQKLSNENIQIFTPERIIQCPKCVK